MNPNSYVSCLENVAHITGPDVLLVGRVHMCFSKTYSEGDVLWQLHCGLLPKLPRGQNETGRKFSLLDLE